MRKGRRRATSEPCEIPSVKKLRVAVVTDGIYPYFKGGKEVRFHHLLRRLAGPEVEIDVYTMHWWDGPRDRNEEGVSLHAICRNWDMYAGERRSLAQALMFALACTRLLTVEADVIDADHMPYLQLIPLKVISRLRGIPLIVTWHEWWGETYWQSYLGRPGRLAARVERFVVSLADCLIVPTEQTAETMTAAGVDRNAIAVLPSGIDTDAIALVGPAQRRYDIVFVGRLLHHKGAALLLGALNELRERIETQVSCAIVGEGPEKPQLDLLVHQLGLDTGVEFLGRLESQESVFALIKSATVFALPTTREGFGIAVAEALACGTQVVTTDHDANQARHLIKDGVSGFLCDPTVGSLADALEKALSCPLPTEQVRAHALSGWQTLADDLGTIYTSLVPA